MCGMAFRLLNVLSKVLPESWWLIGLLCWDREALSGTEFKKRCGGVPKPPPHSCERTKLLHARLVHPRKTAFREMAMKGTVRGIYPTDVPCNECKHHVCDACIAGKQTQASFPEAGEDIVVD